MSEVAFVSVSLFRGAAFDRTFSYDLSAVEEHTCLFIIKLHCGYLLELSLFVERADEPVCDFGVDLLASAESRSCKKVRGNSVSIECSLLLIVVSLDELFKCSVKFAVLHLDSPALGDRRTVAVCSADEYNVFLADPVTHEARESVRKHEHSANVTEVELLVAVGHTASDNCSFREHGTRYLKILVVFISHFPILFYNYLANLSMRALTMSSPRTWLTSQMSGAFA